MISINLCTLQTVKFRLIYSQIKLWINKKTRPTFANELQQSNRDFCEPERIMAHSISRGQVKQHFTLGVNMAKYLYSTLCILVVSSLFAICQLRHAASYYHLTTFSLQILHVFFFLWLSDLILSHLNTPYSSCFTCSMNLTS